MKLSVYFDRSKKKSSGEFGIYLRLYENGKRKLVATGLSSPCEFKGLAFPTSVSNSAAKTARLADLFSRSEEWLYHNNTATLQTATEAVRLLVSGGDVHQKKSVSDYLRDYAETRKGNRTMQMYRLSAKRIEAFCGGVCFDDVSRGWLERYERWMSDNGLAVNSISIEMRNIRTVFNWAIDEGVTANYPFRKYKIKSAKTPSRAMSVDELVYIRDCEVESWQEEYRDLFVLSFYLCGINACDLLTLRKSDFSNGRITYTRRKTGGLIDIPVPPVAKRIISKYKGSGDWLLRPMDTNSDYRHYYAHWCRALRMICLSHKKVFGGRFVTTYWSRHTWATTASSLGIDREIIALCLGHSWADVTSVYIAPNCDARDKAVLRVAKFISEKS